MKNILISIFFISFVHKGAIEVYYFENELNRSQTTKSVIVYGSDTCHFCLDTKKYLKEKKVTFVYFDVDINVEKQKEMLFKLRKARISTSNLSLPVIDKDGEIFTNSNPFEAFLKKIIE